MEHGTWLTGTLIYLAAAVVAVPLARLLESAPVTTPVLAQPVSQSMLHRHTIGKNFIGIGFSTDEAQPER